MNTGDFFDSENFDTPKVFELFSSKEKLFTFGFLYDLEMRGCTKTPREVPQFVLKGSASKKLFFLNSRIRQYPGSGLVNDLWGGLISQLLMNRIGSQKLSGSDVSIDLQREVPRGKALLRISSSPD